MQNNLKIIRENRKIPSFTVRLDSEESIYKDRFITIIAIVTGLAALVRFICGKYNIYFPSLYLTYDFTYDLAFKFILAGISFAFTIMRLTSFTELPKATFYFVHNQLDIEKNEGSGKHRYKRIYKIPFDKITSFDVSFLEETKKSKGMLMYSISSKCVINFSMEHKPIMLFTHKLEKQADQWQKETLFKEYKESIISDIKELAEKIGNPEIIQQKGSKTKFLPAVYVFLVFFGILASFFL